MTYLAPIIIGSMKSEHPNRNPLNRQLAHEVVAYAEACAMHDQTEDHFEQLLHDR